MGEKSITLIAGTEQTRIALAKQLEYYLSDIAKITSYAIDEGLDKEVKDEIVILSCQLVMEEVLEKKLLDKKSKTIIATRTINFDYIENIVCLPPNTDVLFVNDVMETAMEGIESLENLGIDYLNFIPYCPGLKLKGAKPQIAITPGEVDKVPSFVKRVYDLGPRIMDFTTMAKILRELDALDKKAGDFSQRYLEKIIKVAKGLALSNSQVTKLNDHLRHVIDGLRDGLLVYDVEGNVSIINENLRKILKLPQNLRNNNVRDIIYNKQLLFFLMDQEGNEECFMEINGQEVAVNKLSINKDKDIVATFKSKRGAEEDKKIKAELADKGFIAKYTFEDIIGKSLSIKEVKDICKRLAKTDLTMLIEGESGTGKELFASAIHNSSRRKNGAFLAVNFSALPDELIESELFGYEEGAFTGAKKGGKPGLFEQAHGGTIFLDEIGDISLKVQARLLRVLQEKEVMRIGGSEIRRIDVRVIAATNKDLVKMVNQKSFREDLYYRLKMGYVKLPPLRERKEDMVDLMNYFIGIEAREDIQISTEVKEYLLRYDWHGNIRELINTLSYMLAVRQSKILTMKDVPQKEFFKDITKKEELQQVIEMIDLQEDCLFILKEIYNLQRMGMSAGRHIISQNSKSTLYPMGEAQVRSRMDKLEEMGLIQKKKGRTGTLITAKAKRMLEGMGC